MSKKYSRVVFKRGRTAHLVDIWVNGEFPYALCGWGAFKCHPAEDADKTCSQCARVARRMEASELIYSKLFGGGK